MKYIYYQRSRLHLLSIVGKLRLHLFHKAVKVNNPTFDQVAEKLRELDKATQCLDHRLAHLKAAPELGEPLTAQKSPEKQVVH